MTESFLTQICCWHFYKYIGYKLKTRLDQTIRRNQNEFYKIRSSLTYTHGDFYFYKFYISLISLCLCQNFSNIHQTYSDNLIFSNKSSDIPKHPQTSWNILLLFLLYFICPSFWKDRILGSRIPDIHFKESGHFLSKQNIALTRIFQTNNNSP